MCPFSRLSIVSQNQFNFASSAGASIVPPGLSVPGGLRPPSVSGPPNNASGPPPLVQSRMSYSIQPTPGGPVTPGPVRPPSSSPMPQPGANLQEGQEANFRHLLRMGNLPPSLWNIQGKQIDPWLLHRTVHSSGGLQQVCAHTIGPRSVSHRNACV